MEYFETEIFAPNDSCSETVRFCYARSQAILLAFAVYCLASNIFPVVESPPGFGINVMNFH